MSTNVKNTEVRMNILIIEPHPDDCCLSFTHLAKKLIHEGNTLSLVSIASFPEPKRSSELYCKELGINYISSEFINDIDYDNRIRPNIIKQQPDPVTYQFIYYLEMYPDRYLEVQNKVHNFISHVNPDLVITTAGILHPMHVLVTHAVINGYKVKYFADSPYQFKQFGKYILAKSNLRPSLEYSPTKEEVKEKLNLFIKCYPTEVSILRWDRAHFENPESKEILLEAK